MTVTFGRWTLRVTRKKRLTDKVVKYQLNVAHGSQLEPASISGI